MVLLLTTLWLEMQSSWRVGTVMGVEALGEILENEPHSSYMEAFATKVICDCRRPLRTIALSWRDGIFFLQAIDPLRRILCLSTVPHTSLTQVVAVPVSLPIIAIRVYSKVSTKMKGRLHLSMHLESSIYIMMRTKFLFLFPVRSSF